MNYWIWFSQINSLGPIQKMILLDKFSTPEAIFKAKIETIEKIDGITKNGIYGIKNSKNIELINKYEDYINSHSIKLINICDEAYPQALREIYSPPITLFAKGDISLLGQKSIAIVGCRDASNYGIKCAKELAYSIARKNIVIVSGLAKGVDVAGHRGALDANGKTIAVLGCGVDICYPHENVEVYKKISESGLLLSEYIVGTKPSPEYFPMRNRIISRIVKWCISY